MGALRQKDFLLLLYSKNFYREAHLYFGEFFYQHRKR